ncbi:MAG: ribbon-helix-helix domain-containing protein [Actinomycetota bacterium]
MTVTVAVPSQLPRIQVYLEPELKERAEKLAKKQRRSLSALICVLLEEATKELDEGKDT